MSERDGERNERHVNGSGHRWLLPPETVDRIVRALYAVCLLLVVAGVAFQLLTHAFDHAHFGFERWPGFYGLFGFAAFVVVVYLGRWWRKVVGRPEDYYEPPDPRPRK